MRYAELKAEALRLALDHPDRALVYATLALAEATREPIPYEVAYEREAPVTIADYKLGAGGW